MIEFKPEYLAAGGNKHPAAADWDVTSGVLAYGTDRNVALWKPVVVHVPPLDSSLTHSMDRTRTTRACMRYFVVILAKSTPSNSAHL